MGWKQRLAVFRKHPKSALFLEHFLPKNDTDHVFYPQLNKLIMPKIL